MKFFLFDKNLLQSYILFRNGSSYIRRYMRFFVIMFLLPKFLIFCNSAEVFYDFVVSSTLQCNKETVQRFFKKIFFKSMLLDSFRLLIISNLIEDTYWMFFLFSASTFCSPFSMRCETVSVISTHPPYSYSSPTSTTHSTGRSSAFRT